MARRLYQCLLLLSLAVCTFLFAKEIQTNQIVRFEHADKVAHFGVFFILAFFSHHAFRFKIWFHLVLLTLYGAGIEWMQDSLPYRQASWGDFMADLAGAISYFAAYWIYCRKTGKSYV
ncbi:VanZ family protein [Pseudoalteromonas rubra]|uniref:VanZ family protein n=1 Tax=Pseudoalteromonas rubra TaxID=43658 RepID=UPI001486FA30|nr:VanZ family protein [Pseudoalteromonas rubra]